ncbi:MAG TPA: DUF4383 domain-containing protein [Gemmatimonadales bacterium]|jgi:hypothetical protein|nr:DUF4383 domain-containing protein [Gemmatimonadales bacterium]
MTLVQRVAQLSGIVLIILAVLGFFVSSGSMEPDPALASRVIALFPVNLLLNLLHLVLGIWGVFACRSFVAGRAYCQVAGVIFILLAILGFIIPTTFGIMPIGGNEIWLHAIFGIVLIVAGLTARSDMVTPTSMNI